jgi:TPR repeat protein
VGRAYHLGLLGVALDYDVAAGWYRAAVARDIGTAANGSAFLYEHGQGVPRDDTQTVARLRKADALGHASPRLDWAAHTGTANLVCRPTQRPR